MLIIFESKHDLLTCNLFLVARRPTLKIKQVDPSCKYACICSLGHANAPIPVVGSELIKPETRAELAQNHEGVVLDWFLPLMELKSLV